MGRTSVINGCMKVEKSAASIYKNLMQRFPKHEDFWKMLFDDEIKHLSFFKDVKSIGLINEMEKIDLLPSMPVINKTLKLAGSITKKIKGGSLSFVDALKITLKLEESMAETYTNKIIAHLMSCDSEPSYKNIIADERKHINKIKNMMKLRMK